MQIRSLFVELTLSALELDLEKIERELRQQINDYLFYRLLNPVPSVSGCDFRSGIEIRARARFSTDHQLKQLLEMALPQFGMGTIGIG
jgi:hypothetical protein